MYFKINPSGCGERKGLCEVRYDLYLDLGDYNYIEHHVTVPVFPPEGYPGAKDETGFPLDIEDYKAWVSTLLTVTRDNPFCCHFFQHEPTVTDEEILAKGEEVLIMAYQNWQKNDLRLNKNPKVNFSTEAQQKADSAIRAEEIKITDFAKIETVGVYRVK